jgi:hypothetical protein
VDFDVAKAAQILRIRVGREKKMERLCTWLAAGLCIGVFASRTSAAIIYDTTTTTNDLLANPFGPAPMLDDVQFVLPSGAPPVNITGIRFAAGNVAGTTQNVDVRVTFFESANTSAADETVVEFGQIGSPILFSNLSVPANGSNIFNFTFASPVQVSDGNAAVRLTFFNAGTSTVSSNVDAMLAIDLPTVGNTFDGYWTDAGTFNQSFTGDERVDGTEEIHANFYLRLEGEPVPEPATVGLLGILGTTCLLIRRRPKAV